MKNILTTERPLTTTIRNLFGIMSNLSGKTFLVSVLRQDLMVLLLPNHQKRLKCLMNISSLFSQLKISIPDKEISSYPSIPEINITLQVVTNVLYNCNPYKLPSPDHLNATFLKHASTEIASMLIHLFQQSLRDNSIPVKWKQAYITPIFKKGNRSEPKNYHPVSLTYSFAKAWNKSLWTKLWNI